MDFMVIEDDDLCDNDRVFVWKECDGTNENALTEVLPQTSARSAVLAPAYILMVD